MCLLLQLLVICHVHYRKMVSFAVVAVYLGLPTDQVGLRKKGCYAVICFIIAVCFVFLFELYLIMSKQNRETRAVPVGVTRGRKLHFVGLVFNVV